MSEVMAAEMERAVLEAEHQRDRALAELETWQAAHDARERECDALREAGAALALGLRLHARSHTMLARKTREELTGLADAWDAAVAAGGNAVLARELAGVRKSDSAWLCGMNHEHETKWLALRCNRRERRALGALGEGDTNPSAP